MRYFFTDYDDLGWFSKDNLLAANSNWQRCPGAERCGQSYLHRASQPDAQHLVRI